ncbi:ArnT family glycosyltransferase [Hyella patelloides]|uniref:ArnT family glycosyltransferase n=1 Tax=Hyella patelloides TaxID=1982969 RepID=UPI001C962D3F|nr:glycosyltransferase family 39 protein [Hyella patelloides]
MPLKKSITYDEPDHYASGIAILSGKPSERAATDANYRNNIPISALNVLISKAFPENIISELTEYKWTFYDGKTYPDGRLYCGRLATIFASVILAIYVFCWARQLYGIHAGFLALSLYILDPNIIAHSRLVTQDIFSACSVFIATYYFWNFLKFGGQKNVVLSIITFAIAQITRYGSIYLLPIYLVLVIGFHGSNIVKLIQTRNFKIIISSIKKFCYYTTLFLLTTILIINISFSFDKTFTKLGNYKFESQFFTSLQSSYSLLRQLPIPVPYAYMQGLDFGKYKHEIGFGSGASYLMGRLGIENGRLKGFKEYYIIAFLYKVPIATQLLLLMAVISSIRYQNRLKFWQNEAFLIIPSLLFLIVFSFSIAQLGIRYVLMIFPFLFVFSSRVTVGWIAFKNRYRIFIISLVAYLLISNLSYFPHYISYFNELLVDRKMGYTILADSNLDWGQNWIYLDQYLKKNPDAIYMRYLREEETLELLKGRPEVDLRDLRHFGNRIRDRLVGVDPAKFKGGLVAIQANQLVGVINDPKIFQWLRENKKPVDHIGYSFLIFKIQPHELHNLSTDNND